VEGGRFGYEGRVLAFVRLGWYFYVHVYLTESVDFCGVCFCNGRYCVRFYLTAANSNGTCQVCWK
jgi:hypothetical protein